MLLFPDAISMEKNSKEANSLTVGQEIHRFLWNLMADYVVYKSGSLVMD
jgi:hypothetical protein